VDEERRDELLAEIARWVRGWLDGAGDRYPEGFDVGTVGIAFDMHLADGTSHVSYACSDGRPWVHSGLFRAAMHAADANDAVADEEELQEDESADR
jgi:hypothetical protein